MLITLLSGILFFSFPNAYDSCDILAPEYCPTIWNPY